MASMLQTSGITNSRFSGHPTSERPLSRRSITNTENLQTFGWNGINNIWQPNPQKPSNETENRPDSSSENMFSGAAEYERFHQPSTSSTLENGSPFGFQDASSYSKPMQRSYNGTTSAMDNGIGSFTSPIKPRKDESSTSFHNSLSLSKSGLLLGSNPDIDPYPQRVSGKQSFTVNTSHNSWQNIREFQPLSVIQNGQYRPSPRLGDGPLRSHNGPRPGQSPSENGFSNSSNRRDVQSRPFQPQRAVSSDFRSTSTNSPSYAPAAFEYGPGWEEINNDRDAYFLSSAFDNMKLQYPDSQYWDDRTRFSGSMAPNQSRRGAQPNIFSPSAAYDGDRTASAKWPTQNPFEHQYSVSSGRNGYATHKGSNSSSTNEYRSKISTPYFPTSVTPTVSSESRRSNSTSESSTRGSHSSVAVLEQRLRSLEPQPDGLVPNPPYQHQMAYSNHHDYGVTAAAVRPSPYQGQYSPDHALPGTYVTDFNSTDRRNDSNQIIRSALLEDFRMNSKNQRYELKDIYNHVVEFSGDQHGSRFIQQKLETANSEEKDQIFNEIASDSLQLMTDVFGNYVIQKMFEHGNQSQKKVLANYMKGHILALSMQMYGCRVVQKALEHILTDQQASLIRELDGHVLKVVENQNGNHVIQKAIERVPGEHIQFIVDAYRGHVYELSKHAYGCRVIQRMLEYCHPHAKRVILDELQQNIGLLIKDSFGNYVVQHVIVNGETKDRRPVIDMVQADLLVNSKHKFASNVVEKAIDYAEEEQRGLMLQKLTTGRDKYGQTYVMDLLKDQYGNYVIQKCLSHLSGPPLQALIFEVEQYLTHLRRISSGKQVGALETSIKDARQRLEAGRLVDNFHTNNQRW